MEDIKEGIIRFIILYDTKAKRAKLEKLTLIELIAIKTEMELAQRLLSIKK